MWEEHVLGYASHPYLQCSSMPTQCLLPSHPIASLAASEWRLRVAAALGRTTQQLPRDRAPITALLKQAAASCVQKLVSAAAVGQRLSSEKLLPVLEAAIASSIPAAVAVTLAAGGTKVWKAAVLEEQISAAAAIGCAKSFKLLVQAAEAAEVAEVQEKGPKAAAAAGSRSAAEGADLEQIAILVVLKQALKSAVQHQQRLLAAWVLERGLQARGWTAQNMAPAIAACIQHGWPQQLNRLLVGCGVAWQHSNLKAHVSSAAANEKAGVSLLQHIFAAAAAAAEAPWTDEELSEALAIAVGVNGDGQEAADYLLRKPVKGWGHVWLLPAVEQTVQTHRARAKPEKLRILLAAARGLWTAAQLSNQLKLAAQFRDGASVEVILGVKGVRWAAADIAPAAVAAAAVGTYNPKQLRQLLQAPLVSPWEGGQLEAVAQAAVEHRFPSGLELVLNLPASATELTADKIKGLLRLLLGRSVGELERLVGHSSWSCGLQGFRDHFSKCAAACLQLLALPNAAWQAHDLADLLAVAAAVGDLGIVKSVLEQEGVVWQVQQLVPAIQSALLAETWTVLPVILEALKGEAAWVGADFVPALQSVCMHGHVEGCKQLQLLLAMASVDFTSAEKLEAVAAAVNNGRADFLSYLLSGPFADAGWGAEELKDVLSRAMEEFDDSNAACVTAVKQLLLYPKQGWTGADLKTAVDIADKGWRWGFLKMLYGMAGAGEGLSGLELKTLPARLLQRYRWVQQVPELLGMRQWHGGELEEVLQAAVDLEQWEVVGQLLSHVREGWDAEVLTSLLEFAAASGHLQVVMCLLAARVGLTAASLDRASEAAIAEGEWDVVQLLLEVEGAGWIGGGLGEALVTFMHPQCAEQLKVLLTVPGVVWEGEILQKAVHAGVLLESWLGLEELAFAASVKWKPEQLKQLLVSVVKAEKEDLLKKLVADGAIELLRSSQEAAAAAVVVAAATSAAAKRGDLSMLELILWKPYGLWSKSILVDALTAAARDGCRAVMLLLLWVPGASWKDLQLQPTVEAAAGNQMWQAVQLLLQWKGVEWEAVHLKQVLAYAAAAENLEMVKEVLGVVDHGWVGEDMAAAAAAAAAGTHWGVLGQLLGVEAAGWVVGILRGLLVMSVSGGLAGDVLAMMLEMPGVLWEGSEVAEAIGVAERRGDVGAVQQLRAAAIRSDDA